MATTCFGPPPLPPNKRSLSFNRHNRKCNPELLNNSSSSLMSSTYLSFRDPAEESDIITPIAIDVNRNSAFVNCNNNKNKDDSRRARKLSMSQFNHHQHQNQQQQRYQEDLEKQEDALNYYKEYGFKSTMTRSHSDGNLHKRRSIIQPSMTINKYVKMLSGSWKNLINCK